MKLIVGLGNPGRKYQGTRHNIGFEVLAAVGRKYAIGGVRQKFKGDICEARIGETSVLLLSPTTYMNLSGSSVLAARDFYRLPPQDILVVCDDFHLALAHLRFRASGSAGGQKGLADILHRLGTEEIPRLRCGIGRPPPRWDPADYVLGKFAAEDLQEVEQMIERATLAVADWTSLGMADCMNKYNSKQTN